MLEMESMVFCSDLFCLFVYLSEILLKRMLKTCSNISKRRLPTHFIHWSISCYISNKNRDKIIDFCRQLNQKIWVTKKVSSLMNQDRQYSFITQCIYQKKINTAVRPKSAFSWRQHGHPPLPVLIPFKHYHLKFKSTK